MAPFPSFDRIWENSRQFVAVSWISGTAPRVQIHWYLPDRSTEYNDYLSASTSCYLSSRERERERERERQRQRQRQRQRERERERERERDWNSENSAFCSKSSPPYVPRVLYFLVSSESCVKLPILFSPPHAGIFFERNTPIPHFRSIHKVWNASLRLARIYRCFF